MFPQVGGKQAADSGVSEEHVKVPQQAAFGFIRFVLLLQGTVWDDLLRIQAQVMSTARIQRRRKEFWIPDFTNFHIITVHFISTCWRNVFVVWTVGYLCDVLHSILLQQLLVEPLYLFWRHLGLVSDKEASLVCVCALAMGQGTDNGVKRQCQVRVTAAKISLQVRLELSFVTPCYTLTCGWSGPPWGFSTGWRAGWSAASRPATGTPRPTLFSGKPARLGRPFSPETNTTTQVLKKLYWHAERKFYPPIQTRHRS